MKTCSMLYKMLKRILVLSLLAAFAAGDNLHNSFLARHPQIPPRGRTTVEHTHEQILDHYKPLDGRKFGQRYFQRTDAYVEGGPIFLFLTGNWEATGGFLSDVSFITQMMNETGGMAFELEHRYYGASLPFPNHETENLQYIGLDQVLADAANFALAMTDLHGLAGPWIICGTSYSGMLAGFARQKYSHIFHAAYSSSGQMEAKIDFHEYHEMTGVSLGKVNPLCPGYLAAAMDEFVARVETQDPNELQFIIESFDICNSSDLTIEKDAQYLYTVVANIYGAVVQYAIPGSIEAECDLLINGGGTPLENLANVIRLTFTGCFEISYQGYVDYYKNITEPFEGNIYRQRIYQSCTEMGWFFTLSAQSPFGAIIPLSFYADSCKNVFGDAFSLELLQSGVERTNLEFGGKNPDVTRVLFTHGSFDGWTKVAAETDVGPESPVIIIDGVGHGADVLFFDTDPPQLHQARAQIKLIIESWIMEF